MTETITIPLNVITIESQLQEAIYGKHHTQLMQHISTTKVTNPTRHQQSSQLSNTLHEYLNTTQNSRKRGQIDPIEAMLLHLLK